MTFALYVNQLGVYAQAMRHVVEPGPVEVLVGNSSQHLPLTGAFEVIGRATDISDGKVFFSDVKTN